MSLTQDPTWRANLSAALAQNSRQAASRFAQLATCNTLGQASCRTVVFRGFVDNSNALIVHTHQHSEKIKHLQANCDVELCWYFTETREQFRLKGKMEVIDGEGAFQALREQQWHTLSNANQQSYTQQSPEQSFKPEMHDAVHEIKTPIIESFGRIPDTFILLLLWPGLVDHLLLTPTPQERYLHSLDKNKHWQVNRVTP